jgi:hypothetical protein
MPLHPPLVRFGQHSLERSVEGLLDERESEGKNGLDGCVEAGVVRARTEVVDVPLDLGLAVVRDLEDRRDPGEEAASRAVRGESAKEAREQKDGRGECTSHLE